MRLLACCLLFQATALAASGADYPCWRGADGSGAGIDCGKPLVADLAQARWVWESEEKRMSSCYGHLQGGVGCMAIAGGRLYHPYAYPGGPADAVFQAKLLEKYQQVLAAKGSKDLFCLQRWIGTSGLTPEQFAEVMARPLMHDRIICIDAATGKTVWQHESPTARPNIFGRGADGAVGTLTKTLKPKKGPHNTPAIAYGKVAVVGYGGTLYCLDAATGKEAWRKEVIPHNAGELANGNSALCTASVLYGGGHFICIKAGAGFVAFDPATGAERWTFKPGYTPCGAQGPIRFTHSGKDLMLYGAVCVDLATGATLWTAEGANGASGSPCVGEGYAVFGGSAKQAGLSCFKLDADPAKPPQKAWALDPAFAVIHDCTPVIHRGHVYTKMDNAEGLAGGDILFVAVELATGKMLKLASHTDSHASMTAADGRIFYEGIQFNAAPDFTPIAGVSTFLQTGDNSPNYANSHTPPIIDGRLYLKGNNSIRCLDLRAP